MPALLTYIFGFTLLLQFLSLVLKSMAKKLNIYPNDQGNPGIARLTYLLLKEYIEIEVIK